MTKTCADCGFENVDVRTVCKQCRKPLVPSVPAAFEADASYNRRVLLLLAGTLVVPIGILLLYVTLAGEAAFALNGESRVADLFTQIAALLSGLLLMGLLPFRPWVRVLLAVLYIPVFGVIDFMFLVYFACAIGRGCL